MDSYEEIISFARNHLGEDPLKLLLQQERYPSVDLRLVAQQLEGNGQASAKWPTFARCTNYFYPPRINREQSSSESTALYKAALFQSLGCHTFADLTGGMGVDTYFFSQHACQGLYCERDAELFNLTKRNLQCLGAQHIDCHYGDCMTFLQENDNVFDLLYIDPARRDSRGRKVAAFEHCTPNLLEHLSLLRHCCRYLLVKASPMIDIHQALSQLGVVHQVHIVALNNECKEVLFLLLGDRCSSSSATPLAIHCVELNAAKTADFYFLPQEENEAAASYASRMGTYLYEPHTAILKGGAFRLVSTRYGVDKLARNTHLYTSDRLIAEFPGRTFRVLQQLPLHPKKIDSLLPDRLAHVVTRNYPIAAADLQKKLKLSEGGHLFVIAATLGSTPCGWLCEEIKQPNRPC